MENFDSYIGQVFDGKFNIINVIGAGEYSVVFGAFDTVENRTVAIKIQRPEYNDDPIVSNRFASEARILSMLSHPNIVKLYESNLNAPTRYFAMEYIEGINLKKHILSRGALDTEEILFFSRQILSALEEVHDKGIVHSDIKPQNIVVLADGSIRLMDFGISTQDTPRILFDPNASYENDPTFGGIFSDDPLPDPGEDAEGEQTPSLAVGTVHYVSPEQAEGKSLDSLSDLYSFGVMLYEMTTGILPFFGENAQKIATMHVRLQPIPPTHLNPHIPEGLEKIILRAMEKLPFARFPSATAMLEALEEFATSLHLPKEKKEEPTEVAPVSFPESVKAFIKNYFQEFNPISFTTGVLCALLVTVVVSLGFLSQALMAERNNPSHVKIPDLVNKDYISVIESLDPDAYEVTVRFVDDHSMQGRVKSQSPAAGAVKKTGDEPCPITITVARRSLPPVMPDLCRLPYQTVADILRAYDCEVEIVEKRHAYVAPGEIIGTIPAAGERTEHAITLYVSAAW